MAFFSRTISPDRQTGEQASHEGSTFSKAISIPGRYTSEQETYPFKFPESTP